MKPIKLSTLMLVLAGLCAGVALFKWVALPLVGLYDPSGIAATVLTYAVPPVAVVWALAVLVQDLEGGN